MKNLKWLWVSVLVVFVDQLTKYLALAYLPLNVPHNVWPFMNLTLTYNKGAAFSFLANMGGWQIPFLALVAVVVAIALLVWLFRSESGAVLQPLALSLLIGGAVGNMIDRLRFHYVIDFFQFHWHGYYFAIFNVADTAVTVGAILLILAMIRQH